jgi:hypothetical protein
MLLERRELSHLRADARWCVFREVAVNVVPDGRTIRVFDCECGLAIRLIEQGAGLPDDVVAAGPHEPRTERER